MKLERIDEAGNLHSTTVSHFERPELTSEVDLGLSHDDGKFLIRRVQAEIAQDQAGEATMRSRDKKSRWAMDIAGIKWLTS